MKKKLFDGKLYLEGLRQTKVAGIILAIITILLSAASPIFYMIDYYYSMTTSFGEINQVDIIQIELTEFTPLLGVFMFVLPIVLTSSLFSFLNKRNGSDFYHSLPCTRSCLFVSFSAAIMTWVAGTMLATVLLNGFLYSIAPGTTMSWLFVPYSFFTYFSGALLVMAVMLLAKSLTGTSFNGIILAGIIGYFPRLLTHLFDALITELVPIVQTGNLGIFSDLSYNIPVYYSMGSFFLMFEETNLAFIGGIIYTTVLALIYLGIALLVFKKRKSETAQRSAPSKWMQHVFRCLITIPVTFLFLGLWISDSGDVFSYSLIFFFALLVYLGYELITTKKVKNLLKALPVFPAVIAFDAVFIVALLLTQNVLLADTPDAAQIQAVSVDLNTDNFYYFYDNHYNDLLVQDYYIDDATLEETVSQGLKEAVDAIKNDTYEQKAYISGQYYEIPVSIRKNNGIVIKRNVLFSKDQLEQVKERYAKEKSYQQMQVQLPTLAELNSVYIDGVYMNNRAEFWEIFCQEYEVLSQEEKLAVIEAGMEVGMSKQIILNVYGYMDTTSYYVDYGINEALFPNTYTWCLTYLNAEGQKIIDTFWQEVDGGINANYGYEISFGQVDEDWGNYYACYVGNPEAQYWYYDEIDEFSQLPAALWTLQAATSRTVTATEPVYVLSVDKQIGTGEFDFYAETYAEVYFNLTPEEYEILKPYLTGEGQS